MSGGQAAAEGLRPLLELRDIRVRLGHSLALDRASLAVHPGDTVAVLGPDGAGKSTLLRVMAGLVRPSTGVVHRHLPRTGLGYASAVFDLYGDLTVLENLRFFGRVRGLGAEKLSERVEAMLSLTGLREAGDRLAGRLSGGMKKGLALGCALVHEPSLLLLDEPTVGVDPVSRQRLWDIISETTAGGTALVFTSCYLEEAGHAVRLAAMAGGRLFETTADEVLRAAAGWTAWIQPVPGARTEVRARLAQAAAEPRVYLRPEGLAVLAEDETTARRLLAQTVGEDLARGALDQSPLTFEDAFVLLEGRELAGPADGGADGAPRPVKTEGPRS